MESDADTEAAATGTVTGAAQEFIVEAMRLRCSAQRLYAEKALERLNEIAMKPDPGPVQVSALRVLFEQVLGRPMPVVALPAKQDEDPLAAIAALGARLREKLDRISNPGGSEKTDAASD
jgi:hypothetical protein